MRLKVDGLLPGSMIRALIAFGRSVHTRTGGIFVDSENKSLESFDCLERNSLSELTLRKGGPAMATLRKTTNPAWPEACRAPSFQLACHGPDNSRSLLCCPCFTPAPVHFSERKPFLWHFTDSDTSGRRFRAGNPAQVKVPADLKEKNLRSAVIPAVIFGELHREGWRCCALRMAADRFLSVQCCSLFVGVLACSVFAFEQFEELCAGRVESRNKP